MRFFEARSYELHENSNPLFPRKDSSRRYWPWVVGLLVLTTFVTGVVRIIYGPVLSIRTIEVHGTVTIAPEEISTKVQEGFAKKRFLILPNSHQWFFDTKSAEAMLPESFPLKSVNIEKTGSRLRVTVVEDIFMVALRSGDNVYLLDHTGRVIRPAEPAEQAAILVKIGAAAPSESGPVVIHEDMPVLKEKMVVEHLADEQVFDQTTIGNVIQFSEGLGAMGIRPIEFVSDDIALPWFTVTIDKNYVILFDASQDVETQLTVLKTVIDERVTAEEQPRYIDVRFGNRVFVR